MDKYSTTRFNNAPTLNHGRTRFDLSHNVLDTFNTGDFVPFLVEPVYPGETHSLRTTSLTRLETSIHQTMDSAYIEFAYFFVPLKTVFNNFDKFLGANDDPWTQTTEYKLPQIWLTHFNDSTGIASIAECKPGSLLHHLGIPAGQYGAAPGVSDNLDGTKSLSIDRTPLLSVFKIYNDWYRDENYDSIIYYAQADQRLQEGIYFDGTSFYPYKDNLKVNRFKDIFSTSLPSPQKGQDVTVNILDNVYAPVFTGAEHDITGTGITPVKYRTTSNGLPGNGHLLGLSTSATESYLLDAEAQSGTITGFGSGLHPSNLWADLSQEAIVTINQLRLAIVRQAMAERDARSGTRFNEKIHSTWGINVNPLEIDRSEFLGGKRIPITMLEVLQTSETGNTVLGTDAGHSKTFDDSDSFVKSFTQYGWLIGVCYVRTARSYSQGIDRKFFNKVKLDMADPMLDNIGEVPVYKKEIYAPKAGTDAAHPVSLYNAAWGYQEQYYWLKERNNRIAGYYQSGITGTMDSWHYGDDYSDMPQMSYSWLKETADQVDRTIAVQSETAPQWSINLHLEYYVTRGFKKYSIPNTFGF